MRISILFVISIFALNLYASETRYVFYKDSQKYFLSLYAQDSLWNLDLFEEDSAGHLDRLSHKVYPNQALVQKELRTFDIHSPRVFAAEDNRYSSIKRTSSPLWKVTNKWSQQWNNAYAEWVRDNVTPDFFAIHDIPADCADAAYTFHWIFARINGLPAANRLTNGKLFSQDSTRKEWLKIPTDPDWTKDKRFRKAISYLLDTTYTHTLKRDSYPVEINPQTFNEAVHHVFLSGHTGHTFIINEVHPNTTTKNPLKVIWATTPQDLAILSEGGYWQNEQPTEKEGGFMGMLWPVKVGNNWRLMDPQSMPGYSTEQYDPEFMTDHSFGISILKKLAPDFDPLVVYQNGHDLIVEGLKNRVQVVDEGYTQCQIIDCAPGTQGYEDWSTPSRDGRITSQILQLEKFIEDTSLIVADPIDHWTKALKETKISLGHKEYSLGLLRTLWLGGIISSDPRDPVDDRWSVDPKVYTHRLLKKLKPLMALRDDKVSNNPCVQTSCPKKSPLYAQWSTFDIDEAIRILDINRQFYCLNTDLSTCKITESILQSQKTNLPFSSAMKVLAKSPFFLSDPNLSDNYRWGLQKTFETSRHFLNLNFLTENSLGNFLVTDIHGTHIYDDQWTILHKFSPGLQALHFFDDGRAFLFDPSTKKLLYWDGQNSNFVMNSELYKIKKADDNTYFFGPYAISLEQNLSKTWDLSYITSSNISNFAKGRYVFEKFDQMSLHIAEINFNGLKKLTAPLPKGMMNIELGSLVGESPTHLLVHLEGILNGKPKSQYYAVNKTTSEIQLTRLKNTLTSTLEPTALLFVDEKGQDYLEIVDSGFQKIKTIPFKGRVTTSKKGDSQFHLLFENNKTNILTFDSQWNPTKTFILDGEQFPVYFDQKQVVFISFSENNISAIHFDLIHQSVINEYPFLTVINYLSDDPLFQIMGPEAYPDKKLFFSDFENHNAIEGQYLGMQISHSLFPPAGGYKPEGQPLFFFGDFEGQTISTRSKNTLNFYQGNYLIF